MLRPDRIVRSGLGPVIVLLALSSVLLSGCGSNGTTGTATAGSQESVATTSTLVGAQSLPVDATLTVGSTRTDLEVARTPTERDTGLMGRTDLPADRGMLFANSRPIGMSMWMANMLIPLDIVFVRDGIVTKVVSDAPPCTTKQCPIWSSDGPVDAVIELRSGRATELGITTGRPVDITWR